uniref:Reverse transcriptase domain-containing protein n=1 Tax=Oreochromis niloticus TaxID=8128 RepID=A0A669B1C7_ORENI
MYSNFDFIKDYLQQFSRPFSVIAITETWFNVDKVIDFCLNGYDLKYMNRLNKAGGGVAIYVHNSIKYNVVTTMSMAIDGILECLTIEIMNEKKRNVIISCIYRTPSSSIDTFNEWIEKMFASVNQKLLFICGDFNIDLLNPTRLKAIDDFTDTMYSLSLYPTITKPSRITSHSATIIDNIFTNVMDFQINSGLLVCDITDHLTVFTLCDCNLKKIDTKITIAKRTINEEAIHAFNFDLAQQDWSSVYDESDVDKAYDNFLDIFTMLNNKHCPVNEHKTKKKKIKSPWLTKGIINACKKKNNLYKQFIKVKTKEVEQRYKAYRNKLTDIIRTSKQLYYRRRLYENKNNIKGTWVVLNNLIKQGSSGTSYPEYFFDANGENHNMSNIVDGFNKFFINVGPELAADIPCQKNENISNIKSNPFSLFLSATNEQEVINITLKCKSKSSMDYHDINMSVVKQVILNIASPLTYVCNLSFQSGCFPKKMKIAKVIPLYKSNDKHSFTNYRPISLLPQFSKILEKLFNSRLEKFLEKNQIINVGQYGFRTQRTTSMAIIEAVEITNALDKNKYAVGIFVDLKKAFDTINHSILLDKLERYAIRGKAGNWLKSYLTGREQYVSIGHYHSEKLGITCGVPKGSVLGPKLFNVYINDIFDVSQVLKLILFADDTNIFFSSNDYTDLVMTVNRELKLIKKWMDINKLSLNINKTKAMFFGNLKYNIDLPIIIEGVPIDNVSENKFLGVVIDNKISWKPHVRHIKTKISRSLAVLNKVKPYLDKDALRTLYCTLVLPYFTYCVEVWGNTYKNTTNPLVTVQKRALRIIHKAGYLDHTHKLFLQAKLLKFQDLVNYNTSIILYKAFNKLLPANLQTIFEIREGVYNVRGFGEFKLPRTRTTRKGFCVSVCGVKIWNSLSLQLKQCKNIHRFKFLYKQLVWSQYTQGWF